MLKGKSPNLSAEFLDGDTKIVSMKKFCKSGCRFRFSALCFPIIHFFFIKIAAFQNPGPADGFFGFSAVFNSGHISFSSK